MASHRIRHALQIVKKQKVSSCFDWHGRTKRLPDLVAEYISQLRENSLWVTLWVSFRFLEPCILQLVPVHHPPDGSVLAQLGSLNCCDSLALSVFPLFSLSLSSTHSTHSTQFYSLLFSIFCFFVSPLSLPLSVQFSSFLLASDFFTCQGFQFGWLPHLPVHTFLRIGHPFQAAPASPHGRFDSKQRAVTASDHKLRSLREGMALQVHLKAEKAEAMEVGSSLTPTLSSTELNGPAVIYP